MTISIITTTYNSINNLPLLVESLRIQTDKDFEWIVADGNSNDGTLDYLNSLTDIRPKIFSQADFGIYDGLNRGINNSSSDYYIFVGADDILYFNAIENYQKSCDGVADIITAAIEIEGAILRPKRKWVWLYGQHAFVSGFAVGCAIRKNLHLKYGFFSKKFPIAADQLFLLRAAQNDVQIREISNVAGRFNVTGVSSLDVLGSITEFYRVQIACGSNLLVQSIVMLIRILKNINKIRIYSKVRS